MGEGFSDDGGAVHDGLRIAASGQFQHETLDIAQPAAVQCGRHFLDHAEPEILECGDDFGERDAMEAVEFEPQPFGAIFRIAIDADRLVARPRQAVDQANVDRRFVRPCAIAIDHREATGITLRQCGGAACIFGLGQRFLDGGCPAAHHLLQLTVEQDVVGNDPAFTQVERDAQQGKAALFQRDRPAQHRRVGGHGEHFLHREAARGRYFVARQPDEGVEMAGERAARQRELGPWPVGQRHEGQR